MSGSPDVLSSRWTTEFEKQLMRGRHVLLYGNVHDQTLWRGQYATVGRFLNNLFLEKGFQVVVTYDPLDGFSFAASDMAQRFEQLWRAQQPGADEVSFASAPATLPHTTGSSADAAPAPSAGASPPRSRPVPATPGRPQRLPLEEAVARLRIVLAQSVVPVAAIVDLADMLTSDPERFSEAERNVLMLLKRSAGEAAFLRHGRLSGFRNTLVIKAGELRRVPEWLYRDNPFISLVQIARPAKGERLHYARAYLRGDRPGSGFFGGEHLPQEKLNEVAEDFADLTEGFQAWDLEALRRTSFVERIGVSPSSELRRLVDYFKFGLHEDPWQQLDPARIARADAILSERVRGQTSAVKAVAAMLTSARVGIDLGTAGPRGGRPRGVFFFVGPTGVGKTELAKALSELVFSDESAFARFDMSEYKEEHAAEKLAGAPPGFVGYEEGGQLTNRVLERPHSILLFDEIEKAHPRVLDKFLQILEDGRLTDGKGQTAYFNQTAIIFTSNIGASDLTDPLTGAVIRPGIMRQVPLEDAAMFPYEEVERHFRREVEWYFYSRIGRAELLNRLGENIVVFDLLRPGHIASIARKFLEILTRNALERTGFELSFSDSVIERLTRRMCEGENLLLGGRRVKMLLESMVVTPLNAWVFEMGRRLEHSVRLELSLDEADRLNVRRL